jgi:outer membrane lipoprotein-sorting protein
MFQIIWAFALASTLLVADDIEPLKMALQKQANHESVEVTFRQTKKSPALADEIKTMGKLWLIPGKSFRWELGQPAKQTVIFNGGDVLVLNEKDQSAQRFSPDHKTVKPLFLTLGMGEDASFEGLSKLFSIRGTNQENGRFVATFSPKPRSIRKVIKTLLMQVNLDTSFLERVGWVQQDGTEAMTEFFKPTLNEGIPSTTFEVDEARYTWKSE